MLTEEERRHGVIAASAEITAAGVAYHATKRGIKAQNLHAADDAAGESFRHAAATAPK